MARRGRPPHPGPLTPAEERVLACVREGMPNAEIAVRLGVSVNTVRYHVSNLLAKAGAVSREELGRWRPRDGGSGRSWAWFGWPAAKPVAVVLGLVAVASVGAFLFVPLPAAEEVAPVELPEPFTRPDPDELREQGFVDTGQLLEVEGGGDVVLGHSVRDLFSVVLLSGPAQFVELAGSDVHISLDLGVPRGPVSRRLTAANGDFIVWARSLSSDPREEPVLVGASERATLAVWAGDENGNVLHRATITPDGHAWVDPALLPRDAAHDQWSGQMLGIDDEMHAGMLPVGQASTDFHFTGCVSGPCYASYRVLSGPLLAPAAGVFGMRSGGVVDAGVDHRNAALRLGEHWLRRPSRLRL